MEKFKGESILEFTDKFKTDLDCLEYLAQIKCCIQYIFRTYAESFSPIFSKKFIEIVTEKSCAKIENRTNFVDKLCVEITFSGKFAVKIKAETKNCVKICFA